MKKQRLFTIATVAMAVITLTAAMTQAAATTITGNAGGDDSWNTATNWDTGVPSGTVDAVVDDGVLAQVNNGATPSYSGTLTLNANSVLKINKDGGSQNAFEGASSITMNPGSKIQMNLNANSNFPPITLAGNASIEAIWGSSDHQTDNLSAITGAYTLNISGFNNHTFNLNEANTFSELIANAIDGYRIYAKAPGSLGTGDVTINGVPAHLTKGCTLIINAADALDDTATLYLNGAKSDRDAAKLILNADNTIAYFWVDGVQMTGREYNSSSGLTTPNGDPLISGSGTLYVVPITPNNPSPAFGVTVPAGDVELTWENLPANVGSDVWVDVWFGTDPCSLTQVTAAGENMTSKTVSAPVADTYYWQVNSYLQGSATGDPIVGTVFSFIVIDSDNDGLPDSYELANTSPPSATALNPDDDLEPDGLTNIEEYQIGTNPNDADTDDDTLEDGDETTGAGSRPPTDPTDEDTDNDRLSDGVETNTGTYVSASDTGTDPTKSDSDVDGLGDGVETATGTFIDENDTGTNPTLKDSDSDGASDWYEVAGSYTDPTNTADAPIIPHPLPTHNNGDPIDGTKPVKVYILSGQSNMVGFGRVGGTGPGTLQTIVKSEGKFTNMVDGSGNWIARNDVMYRGVITCIGNGPMAPGFGASSGDFGPELGFGQVMGYYYQEPVIVLKSSQGNRSISWDFAPPSTTRFNYNGLTYGGYGDSPGTWPEGTEKPPAEPGAWYAGKQWDDCFMDEADWAPLGSTQPQVENVTDVLDNFAAQYPQYAAQGFEIAGFAWWQGHKDQSNPHAYRYEQNMVNFINDIRDYYENRYPDNTVPDAPFVLATVAFDGGWDNTSPYFLAIANAQLAVTDPNNVYGFKGNVKTVEARGYWRNASISPTAVGYHYNHNAETQMLVGDALGRAMIELQSNSSAYSVNAGVDMITWSGQPVELNAAVQEGVTVTSYDWAADPADGVVFSDPAVEDPTVTITKATGNPSTVTLTLTVSDGINSPVTDTITIDVYDTPCKAARIGLSKAADYPGDLDEDCDIDPDDLRALALTWLADSDLSVFAQIARAWLVDYALTAPLPKGALAVDYDGNFKINLADFAVLASRWGNSTGIADLAELAERWLENYK